MSGVLTLSPAVPSRLQMAAWRERFRSHQVERPAGLIGSRIGPNSGVPPATLSFCTISGQSDLEATLPLIFALVPGAPPQALREAGGNPISVLPGVGPAPGLIDHEGKHDTFFLVHPLTGQHAWELRSRR